MPRKRTTHFALVDSAFVSDPKFMRLARNTDAAGFASSVGVWLILLTVARRDRSPDIAWSDWEEYADQIAELKRVNLLTDNGFNAASFDSWAPVYRGPNERVPKGTQGYAKERDDTDASTQLISTQLTSSLLSSPHLSPKKNGVVDDLNDFDLTNPVDLWAYLFGKEPTERQRDTFLASWINTEGREGTCRLLSAAHAAKASGDRAARDHVAWIEAEVTVRKHERVERATADLAKRKRRGIELDESNRGRYLQAVELWSGRGQKPEDFTFREEDPASVERYIEGVTQ